MTGGWKVEENQKQVSLHFPPALEIAIAIPTFPPPRTRLYSWKGESKTKGPTTLSSGSFFNENMLQEQILRVTVLANGFEYHGKHCASLSAIAHRVTGTR